MLKLNPVTPMLHNSFSSVLRLSLSTAATAAALAAWPVMAQTLPEITVTDSTDSSSTEDTGQYTARSVSIGKTPQSVRDTPQSVSVITRQQLDDRNITKIEDAVKQTTGITVTRLDGAGNYNQILSRGFQIGAIMLDGIPISQGFNYATGFDTAIYDRVEVLRGPAGLLQGGSEPGGSINVVRKRALSALAIGANVSVGSWNAQRADVDVTGALNASGSLRGRVVAVSDQRDSVIDTLFNNKQLGYGTLELDITRDTTLSVGYTKQRVRAAVDQGLPSYANGQLIDVPRSTLAGLAANRQDLDTTDAFAELEHRLDNGGIVKFSMRDVDRSSFYRSARANGAMSANGGLSLQTVDYQQENQDRNYDLFVSSPLSWAGRQHRVLAGISHSESKAYDGNYAYGPNLAFNLFQPNYDLAYPTITLPGYSNITTKTENAAYAQLQLSAAERLKVLLGGRLSWADVAVENYSSGAVTSRFNPGRQFTPSAAVMYDLNAELTAYASYVRTFVVQSALDSANQVLPARTGSQIELGLKGEFLNKRLQTHAAVFQIIDTNRAITDPANTNYSIPGGEVRSRGLELEASGQVAPGWDVLVGYAYTDSKYLQAPVAQVGEVFSTVTPRHSINLFTRYALRTPGLQGWSIGAGLSYRSEFYAQSGTLKLVSGDYALLNGQLAYQVNNKVSVSLNVENLLDKTYYEKVSGVSRQNFYGEPRRAVVSMSMRF